MSSNVEPENVSTYNVDQLFETKSVEEIRSFKSKIGADIEKKKEELRTMVGERYRDLIDAANTITSIKQGAEDVARSIERIETMTKSISSDRFLPAEGSKLRSDSVHDEKKMKRMAYYALAGQIRLLMDAPEALWSAVESKENLLAAEIYLLARQVYHSLKFSPGGGTSSLSCEKIMQWFPVISRQWGAISHFKDVILQASRVHLEDLTISPEAAAEELLVILLLRNVTVEIMLDQFLDYRSKVLETLVDLEESRASSKHQICHLLRLFSNTMTIVHFCFMEEATDVESEASANELLCKIAERTLVAGNIDVKEARKPPLSHMSIHGSPAGKYLPAKIKDFRPNPSHPVKSLPSEVVQSKFLVWVSSCRSSVSENIPLWLGYVESVKNLATIRQAASDVIAEDPLNGAWEVVSSSLLHEQNRFRRWEDLFLPSFTARVSDILDSRLSKLSDDMIARVKEFFSFAEQEGCSEWNLCPYVWSESAGDLPEGEGWIRPATSNQVTLDSGGLPMKTLGYSREVLKMCRWLNQEVVRILEDVEPYVNPSPDRGSFDQRADRSVTLRKLADTTKNAVSKFLEEAFVQLKKSEEEDFKVASAKIIYVARLSQALPQLCGGLKNCITFSKPGTQLQNESVDAEFQKIWDDARASAYLLWRKRIPVEFKAHLKSCFPSFSPEAMLSTLPQWDVMKIEEESEEGAKVVSVISLPMGPSCVLVNSLLMVAEAVNAAGVHVIPPDVRSCLSDDLMKAVLEHYAEHLDNLRGEPVTQPVALQLIFDIQYAAQLLSGRGNAASNKDVSKLRDRLEEFIDPFDLDVYVPHLNGNLKKCSTRSECFLGVLAAKDRAGSLAASEPKSMPGDAAGVSQPPLGAGQARFPLLPLAVQKPQTADAFDFTPTPGHSRSSSYGSNASVEKPAREVKSKTPQGQNSTSDRKRTDARKRTDQGQKSGAAFFFEAIGSNWFGSGST